MICRWTIFEIVQILYRLLLFKREKKNRKYLQIRLNIGSTTGGLSQIQMWSHGLILNIFSMFWLISIFLLNNDVHLSKNFNNHSSTGHLKNFIKNSKTPSCGVVSEYAVACGTTISSFQKGGLDYCLGSNLELQ